MPKDQAIPQKLKFPVPDHSEPPPRASMNEYADFIEHIINATDPHMAARQRQREKKNIPRFHLL